MSTPDCEDLNSELVRRIVNHDEEAFADLYSACHREVLAFAGRLCRDQTSAEEMVQEVFWQVWRDAPRFDPMRESTLAWLMMLTNARALSAQRTGP